MRGLFLRAASPEPEKSSERLTLVLAVAALVLATPLLYFNDVLLDSGSEGELRPAFSAGGASGRLRYPGRRGKAALLRGCILKAIAVCLIAAGSLLIATLWPLSD